MMPDTRPVRTFPQTALEPGDGATLRKAAAAIASALPRAEAAAVLDILNRAAWSQDKSDHKLIAMTLRKHLEKEIAAAGESSTPPTCEPNSFYPLE
jgi:hypothetical protein